MTEVNESEWLRDVDGTGSLHLCDPDDDGAIEYVPADQANYKSLSGSGIPECLDEATEVREKVTGPSQEPDPLTSDFAKALEKHRESIPVAIMDHIDKLQKQIDFSRGGKFGPADQAVSVNTLKRATLIKLLENGSYALNEFGSRGRIHDTAICRHDEISRYNRL